MNYIINPAWVYWMNVCDILKTIFIVTFIILLGVGAIYTFYVACEHADGYMKKEEFAMAKKKIKKIIITVLLMALLIVFVPTKTTLIEMQIAKICTVDNVKGTVDETKEFIYEIIDKIKGVENE